MARPKEALIDRKSIVNAAVAILEKDGIDGFNLRKLANQLSVNPASFYHYFDGKDSILRGVAGQILREVELPPDRYEWKRWMVESTISYWRLIVRKPFIIPIMLQGFRPRTEVANRNEEMMSNAGIPLPYQREITRAFEACAIGTAMVTVTLPGGDAPSNVMAPEETLRLTLTLLLEHFATTLPQERANQAKPARKRAVSSPPRAARKAKRPSKVS